MDINSKINNNTFIQFNIYKIKRVTTISYKTEKEQTELRYSKLLYYLARG